MSSFFLIRLSFIVFRIMEVFDQRDQSTNDEHHDGRSGSVIEKSFSFQFFLSRFEMGNT